MIPLINDLLYECLFFLDWPEYYDYCNQLGLELRFDIYMKKNEDWLGHLSILEICQNSINYINIIKDLCKIQTYSINEIEWATYCGHNNIVKYLYEHLDGAKVTENMLHGVVYRDNLELLEYFYEHGGIYNDSTVPMHHNFINSIKFLHNNGYKFKLKQLYESIKHGNIEAIKLICPTRRKNTYIKKAMQLACKYGHIDIINYLKSIYKIDLFFHLFSPNQNTVI